MIIEDAELDITILLPTTVQVISVSVPSSVARLSSFESQYKVVTDNPKSSNTLPDISNSGDDVVRTNSLVPELLATTEVDIELIAIIISARVSPFVSVTTCPLIDNGFVDVITGAVTVPVTVKAKTVVDIESITTVFPVVSGELFVAVEVSEIPAEALQSVVNVVPSIVNVSPQLPLNAVVVVATVPENVTVVSVVFSTNPLAL